MPYALFENDERLTRPFRTEREVWEAAEQADLITLGTHGEKILDNNFEIKSCDATPEELTVASPDIVFTVARGADPATSNRSSEQPVPPAHRTPAKTSS
ncbi:hypothetical protein S58_39820 [Bradyrhizobium oligotrophicum S58]|uniref:Uncharacterized protein n=1 Tax=Bradyrhizobium oligotrophicum S58 TaxID=1245469 RepID=M4Z8I8_9BRAD|nr:hypothetical protein [Bradyrhizobium oligotrophicum]BAM89968.1 hypothetical protein S58_39820 [Bradyrhizobium oligotrophicum S58]